MIRNALFIAFVFQCLCAASIGFTQDAYTGKWFRATGKWDGKEFSSERLQWRDAEKTENAGQVGGAIDAVEAGAKRFRVGPIFVNVSKDTAIKGFKRDGFKFGDLVRVSGNLRAPRELDATTITKGDTAQLQITGLSGEAVSNLDGTTTLTLLGAPVRLVQTGYGEVKFLTLRQDARRSDKQLTIPVFGRPLTLGGEYVGGLLARQNFKLADDDSGDRDDRKEFQNELKLEAFYPWSETIATFASVKALYNAEFEHRDGSNEVEKALERGETWMYFGRLGGTGLGLQIGRQNIAEAREWWWDDDLDALRLYYDRGPLHTEVTMGQELARKSSLDRGGVDPEKEKVLRLLSFTSWTWAPRQRLEFFAARQDDRSRTQSFGEVIDANREDSSDAKLNWLGARVIGDYSLGSKGNLRYWLDVGWVRGTEQRIDFTDESSGGLKVDDVSRRKIQGTAFDVGTSWELPFKWKPNLTLGFARGSGGGSGDLDRSYRQTGLHANKWRFQGVKRFRYYGELLRPELSNLSVATLGLGMSLLHNSSFDVIYHRYQQVQANDSMREARIRADPNGASRDIGRELDVILGIRENKRWEFALVASQFRGGQAFSQQPNRIARLIQLELTYNF